MANLVKILIIGNGFGGIYTLRNLHKFFHGKKMERKVELALIGKKNYFLFTPLLHEVATGGINASNIVEPIRKVLGCCLDKFYMGQADMVNIKNKTVSVSGTSINYDYLVLATGSETNFYNIPGAEQHSFALKSIEDAIRIKNHCVAQMERASRMDDREERRRVLRFVVVGGGPTGVELAAELEELVKETFAIYYKKEIMKDVSITLIQKNKSLVPQFGEKMQKKSLEVLMRKGIEVRLGSSVLEIGHSKIVLDNNETIFTENVFWVAGIKPVVPEFDEDVEKSSDGRLIANN